MKYKTIKALPNIPIGTEFEYVNNGTSLNAVNGGKGIGPILNFIKGFGIDNDFFELVTEDYKKLRYEKYFYVDNSSKVNSFDNVNDNIDKFLYTTHNYFDTSAEATQYRDYLLALGRINHRIHEMNEGWKSDWWNIEHKYIPITLNPGQQ